MRSLVTYRPYRPSPVNIDRWFDSLFQDWSRPAFATAAPRVDVREQADGYHLEAELPGLSEKDFTVNVEHQPAHHRLAVRAGARARRARLRDPRAPQTAPSSAPSRCRRTPTPSRSAPAFGMDC